MKKIYLILCILSIIAINPIQSQEISTIGEIYDFEVGDEFHITNESLWDAADGSEISYFNRKIIDKYYSENNDSVFYLVDEKRKWAYSPFNEWYFSQDTILDYYTNLGGEIRNGDIDSVYMNSELYNERLINFKDDTLLVDEYEDFYYVNGLGLAYYYYYYYNLSGSEGEEYISLDYFKKGDEEWGTPNIIVSMKENLETLCSIQIYPNPANERAVTLSFQNTEYFQNIELKCFDVFGKEVHSEPSYQYQGESILDIQSWGAGVYFVIVYVDGKPYGECRFVVQ